MRGSAVSAWPADVWLTEALAQELDGDTEAETVRYVKASVIGDLIVATAETPISEETLAMIDDGTGLASPRDIAHIGFCAAVFAMMAAAKESGL